MTYELLSFINKCRICLGEGAHLKLTEFIAERFYDFTAINLASSERFSTKICVSCNSVLIKFSTIKYNFIEAQQKLQELLIREDPIADLSIKEEFDEDEMRYFEQGGLLEPVTQVKEEDEHKKVKLASSDSEPETYDELFDPEPEVYQPQQRKPPSDRKLSSERQQATARRPRKKETKPRSPRKASATKASYRGSLKCDLCVFQCRQELPLQTHKWKEHNGPEPQRHFFICEICSKEFKTHDLFNRHKNMHQQNIRFFCDNCEYKSHARQDLRMHMLTHIKDGPQVTFRCDYEGCNAVYRFAVTLRHHKISFHQKLRPFACNICGKTFPRKARMKQHVKFVHQKIRPFSCDVPGCEMTFAYKSHVVRHKRLIHKIIVETPGKKSGLKRNKE